jgi:pathogenicity locus Cdd1 protein
MKTTLTKAENLEDIPNVGPKIADNLRQLGFEKPEDLRGRDPYVMYGKLCALTGVRHDPCLLDTFIAAVRFMDGGPAVPWWAFTAERKRELASRTSGR